MAVRPEFFQLLRFDTLTDFQTLLDHTPQAAYLDPEIVHTLHAELVDRACLQVPKTLQFLQPFLERHYPADPLTQALDRLAAITTIDTHWVQQEAAWLAELRLTRDQGSQFESVLAKIVNRFSPEPGPLKASTHIVFVRNRHPQDTLVETYLRPAVVRRITTVGEPAGETIFTASHGLGDTFDITARAVQYELRSQQLMASSLQYQFVDHLMYWREFYGEGRSAELACAYLALAYTQPLYRPLSPYVACFGTYEDELILPHVARLPEKVTAAKANGLRMLIVSSPSTADDLVDWQGCDVITYRPGSLKDVLHDITHALTERAHTRASVTTQASHTPVRRTGNPKDTTMAKRYGAQDGSRVVGLANRRNSIMALFGLLLIAAVFFALRPSAVSVPLPSEVPAAHSSSALPSKPSIAVMPFDNPSTDLQQAYLSDGMTEDLITDLSKLSGLFVIARKATFLYQGRSVTPEQISRELDVRYILEGSVRKADKRVRINAQLIDATTGYHVWAERYDRHLGDIFALQDEIVQQIVVALKVTLTDGEQARLVQRATDNLEAHDYVWRGLQYRRRTTQAANGKARRMFEKALELDSTYARAYVYLGGTYFSDWVFQWNRDPQTLDRALNLVQKSLALDDALPEAYMLLASIYMQQRQHEQAVDAGQRAMELDPAGSCAPLAEILLWSGQPQKAITLVKQAMRHNPLSTDAHLFTLGHAYYLLGRREEAITTLQRVLFRSPNHLSGSGLLNGDVQ
ncbi:hypothetical protein C2W62_33185 [Candidatus Entotheonella serta]|nr:hypothetical protein C2W62_33185 [Candidatus Entotheonella serta]